MKFNLFRTFFSLAPFATLAVIAPTVISQGTIHNLELSDYVNITGQNFEVRDSVDTKPSPQELQSILKHGIYDISSIFSVFPRAEFTTGTASALHSAFHSYNFVICHSPHDYNFQGTEGVDWGHVRLYYSGNWEYIKYDVIVGGAGTFTRYGDGGYINWAYEGCIVSRVDSSGQTMVTFCPPTSSQSTLS